jgi:branched-chain amino acid transport system permease protein
MNKLLKRWLRFETILLLIVVLYPLIKWKTAEGDDVGLEPLLFSLTNTPIGPRMTELFIFAILALGLNVVVGYTGQLQLGIAAFFGIGAYITGIVTVSTYPFQVGFWPAVLLATAGAGFAGILLGAPTLRLRGDYLALVTLGFGEVVRFSIRNLEEITKGTQGLNPVPPPWLPEWLAVPLGWLGLGADWGQDYRLFYYLTLAFLVLVVVMLRNLENSRAGRAWMAIREDELAATCMGINAARVKLSAFAMGAALAGLAGCLYVTKLTSTAGPDSFDFNRSIIMLCCVILGGLGSLRGTLLGVFLLIGFDSVLAPILDGFIQESGINAGGNRFLVFTNWRLIIFGLALIIMMRFRPEGLLPSKRIQAELHEWENEPPIPGAPPRRTHSSLFPWRPRAIPGSENPSGGAS